MTKNLISLNDLTNKGFSFNGEGGELCVYKGSSVILKGVKQGSLYILQGSAVDGTVAVASSDDRYSEMTKLWHSRLGHMSERGMQILSKRDLLGGHKVKDLGLCESCIFGKLHRTKFRKGIHSSKGTLDYIHSDCWGPSRVDSLGGSRYFLSIIDDYSRMTWVFMMKHKSEAFECFKHWKTLVENQVGKKVKRLRTDNGLEFCSSEFDKFCRDEGIARHHTVRNTPQQNGVAERMNQTLLERARCMLFNANLPRSFWAEAVSTACYLINRSPHTGIDCKIPYEVWSGKSPDYTNLKAFGCCAYYHVSEGKLEPRAKKGVFVGYGDGVKGYRVWSPSEKRVILSRNVVFDEHSILNSVVKSTSGENASVDKQVELGIQQPGDSQHEHDDHELPDTGAQEDGDMPDNSSPTQAVVEQPRGNERPKRTTIAPVWMQDYVAAYALQAAEEVDSSEPSTYKEALAGPESSQWLAAMGDEMESLYKNDTWELVKRPKGRKLITCKWIFKKKEGRGLRNRVGKIQSSASCKRVHTKGGGRLRGDIFTSG